MSAITVTWVLPDGAQITAAVAPGTSMMQAAIAANVPRILGDCGGNLACATCHVQVAPEWASRTGPATDMEDPMLDMTEVERGPTSRLSCQIIADPALDGLILHVPA